MLHVFVDHLVFWNEGMRTHMYIIFFPCSGGRNKEEGARHLAQAAFRVKLKLVFRQVLLEVLQAPNEVANKGHVEGPQEDHSQER